MWETWSVGVPLAESGYEYGTAFGATDSLLETIAKITTLEKLELSGGIMTDNGLKKLASLTQLKTLVFHEGYHSIPGPLGR